MTQVRAIQIQINPRSHKIGVDEITGLGELMTLALKPVVEFLKDAAYWNEDLEAEPTEYLSRDGFSAYASNCGGREVSLIIPKCEEHNFSFVDFGECDGCDETGKLCTGDDVAFPQHGGECGSYAEGNLDARFRVWLKFEGIDEDTKEMKFYLYAGGGNGDAPYFRTKYETDIFKAEFSAKTFGQFKNQSAKYVARLLKTLRGK